MSLDFDVVKWLVSLVLGAVGSAIGFVMWVVRWRKAERKQELEDLEAERKAREDLEQRLVLEIEKMNSNNEEERKGYRKDISGVKDRLERGNNRMTRIETALEHIPTQQQIAQLSADLSGLKQDQKSTQNTVQLIHEYLMGGGKK